MSALPAMKLKAIPEAVRIDVAKAVAATMDDWSGKRASDAGRVYVALTGKDFSEGAAVTVCKEGTALVIRDVERGRP
jgi:hypothetical protein